jgi:hypothetical protein
MAVINKALGDTLEKKITTWPYQQLKNEWGALKSKQRETFHREQVLSRQKDFGFFDLANPITMAELITWLVTRDPVNLARAAAIEWTKRYMKWRNSPDTQIKSYYNNIKKIVENEKWDIKLKVEPKKEWLKLLGEPKRLGIRAETVGKTWPSVIDVNPINLPSRRMGDITERSKIVQPGTKGKKKK